MSGSLGVTGHVVDVDAVAAAATRYRSSAGAMGEALATLRVVVAALSAPGPSWTTHGPLAAIEAAALSVLLVRLERHLADRVRFAGATTEAVESYRRGDEVAARGWRAAMPTPMPVPVRSSTGLIDPSELGLDDADLYGRQRLEVESVTDVPSTPGTGLADLLEVTHGAYGARGPNGTDGLEGIDVVDVRRRVYVDDDGARRESYVVALPGTSVWDPLDLRLHDERRFRSMRPNLEGVVGRPSAEASLMPEVLRRAGVPPGAEVVLVGHSQGGLTAMTTAALPAMRAYRVQVVTAGSPVGRAPVVPGVGYLHLSNRGDVVPALDGVGDRRGPQEAAVRTGRPRGPAEAHSIDAYVAEARGIDDARHRVPVDPAVDQRLRSLRKAGHLRSPGEVDVVETRRVTIRRR